MLLPFRLNGRHLSVPPSLLGPLSVTGREAPQSVCTQGKSSESAGADRNPMQQLTSAVTAQLPCEGYRAYVCPVHSRRAEAQNSASGKYCRSNPTPACTRQQQEKMFCNINSLMEVCAQTISEGLAWAMQAGTRPERVITIMNPGSGPNVAARDTTLCWQQLSRTGNPREKSKCIPLCPFSPPSLVLS